MSRNLRIAKLSFRLSNVATFSFVALAAFAALASTASVACTVTTNDSADGGARGSDGGIGTDDGGGADEGSAADGGGSSSGDGGANAMGSINVGQSVTGASVRYDIGASFGKFGAPASGGPTCTSKKIGSCTALVCDNIGGDAGAPPNITTTSAGDITITSSGGASVVLSFDGATKRYASKTGATAFFAAGDTLTATAAGADVPAFGGKTVVAPAEIVLTAPTCTGTQCDPIDRTMDLAVTWSGGGAGKVQFTLEALGASKLSTVSCYFDASAHAGTVTAEALSTLLVVDGTSVQGIEIVFPVNEMKFTAGDYPVTFSAQTTGTEGFFTTSK